MESHSPASVQWFFGSVTSVAAELYLHAPGGGLKRGIVSGPRSAYARTLESSVPLAPVDTTKGLWRANIEEPCFWTPRQPYRYIARLEPLTGASAQNVTVPLGVPVLAARERGLESMGKHWVLRAMHATDGVADLLSALHTTGTAMCVDQPGDELCDLASTVGVQLVADFGDTLRGDIESQLRRVARWPAVGIAILPETAELDPRVRRETAHVIRAQEWNRESTGTPRDWAQLLVVNVDDLVEAAILSAAEKLGIVVRRRDFDRGASQDAESQVAQGRQACDSLQTDLAGRFKGEREFAGYLVG